MAFLQYFNLKNYISTENCPLLSKNPTNKQNFSSKIWNSGQFQTNKCKSVLIKVETILVISLLRKFFGQKGENWWIPLISTDFFILGVLILVIYPTLIVLIQPLLGNFYFKWEKWWFWLYFFENFSARKVRIGEFL